MDFGGLDDRFVCSENNNSPYHFDPNPKSYGSGLCKTQLETSVSAEWRDLKAAKTTQDDFSKAMLLQQHQQHQRSNSSSLHFDSHNMLSFSSPNTHQTLALPYYAPNATGHGSGGSVLGVMAGVRGPFTPSQWMELEHQALIYKYITVNAPIPSNLLIPIRKSLETAAFSAYPSSHLRHTTYGWGGFHLGFSNNSDPEPGRCRRTDGKKWRCSRDAVADQKYCERHMNRGRHRSRKPVEGQAGHSVSNGPTTTAAAAKVSASAATSTIVSHLHQLSTGSRMQPGTTSNPATFSHDNRKGKMGSEKIEDATGRSIGLKENLLSVSNSIPFPTTSEFGFVCSDSLLNPLHKNDDGIQKSQNSLRQFMDDWPHSEKTHLSISIPMVSASSSDLMSSTSSPISERLNLSPLRMGLGVGNTSNGASWIPISCESSMGGPLGEVLHHSRTVSPSASALNLMTDGWESSQHMSMNLSSPTGVLQKNTFGSVSNSSAGSSPRTDHLITSSLPLL